MRVSAIAVAAMVVGFVHVARAADPFEGTTWKIKATPDEDAPASAKPFADDVTFKGSQISDIFFAMQSVDAGAYDSNARVGIGTFTGEMKGDGGAVKWAGQITAGTITGTATWTKKDGTAVTYKFTGEKKN